MANNAIETVMGAVVLAVAGGFLYFAYDNSSIKKIDGYAVDAAFTNIGGIAPGSAVRVGGIKVGVVEKLELDPNSYRAVATLRVGNTIVLPKDSSAAVQSSGLLGDKFIAIEPGGDDVNLGDGDVITYTQPSVNIEEMIGKFVFSGGGAESDNSASHAAAPAATPAPVAKAAVEPAPVKETPVKAPVSITAKPVSAAPEKQPKITVDKDMHMAPAKAETPAEKPETSHAAPANTKEPAPASAQ